MEAFNPCIPIPNFPFTYTITNVTTFALTSPTSPSTNITTPTPWMDCRIWRRLPTRILDRILAFLPPPAFFRARSVCKRWYGLLYSESFLQLYLYLSPCHHWFIFFHHKPPTTTTTVVPKRTSTNGVGQTQMAYLFDPYEFKWYNMMFPISLIPAGYSPASSSGGLVCWVSDGPGPKALFLHNPLVGSVTQLPPTARPRLFPSVGLSISGSTIDVTLAGDDLISQYAVKNLTTESFHMDANGFYSIWATTSFLPRLCSLESGHMVHSEGRFYCMNYSPFSILAHDITSNTWWKIQAPMRRFLRSPSLVELRGKLVLVAAVEKGKLKVPRSLRLWALQGCGAQWAEIERMPHQLYSQFEEVEEGRGFDCVGNGEFLVIMIRGFNKGLLFDFETKTWVWMPTCPGFGFGGGGNLHGFAYEPTLAAPVTALVDQLSLPYQLNFTS